MYIIIEAETLNGKKSIYNINTAKYEIEEDLKHAIYCMRRNLEIIKKVYYSKYKKYENN